MGLGSGIQSLRAYAPGLLILLLLTIAFWAPALFEGKTIIHGDFLGHGLPLMEIQSRAIRDFGQLLWSDKVYGGHPLFAEGQGGFANPVNAVFAWVLTPLVGVLYAENLFHWFTMFFSGVGILLLCRQLRLNGASACLAAVAGVFSMYNIGQQQNLTVSGATAWVSWAILAMEIWLERPSMRSAGALGLVIALTFFSGYPETLDGILIYMMAMLIVRLVDRDFRSSWIGNWRAPVLTGLFAIAIGVGLSAIQLLPEAQLVGLSHRSSGIGLLFGPPLEPYLRGFLFTRGLEGSGLYIPISGSILVALLASLTLVLRVSVPMMGQLAGTLILIILGMGPATAAFRFIYDHDLLPQLHFYRLVGLYLNNAAVTLGVLAGAGVEALLRWIGAIAKADNRIAPKEWMRAFALAILAVGWTWLIWRLRLPDVAVLQYAVVLAAILGAAISIWWKVPKAVSPLMAALLVIETAQLRIGLFHFFDPALLRKPASIEAIQKTPDWRDFRTFADNRVGAFTFRPPYAPDVEYGMQRYFPLAPGLANLLWDLRSMDGALALQLGRRALITDRMNDEVLGTTQGVPGARLIDLLSVRFPIVREPTAAPAFQPLWHEHPDDGWIMENTAARPRFQFYTDCEAVASPEEALHRISQLTHPILVIDSADPPANCSASGDAQAATAASAPRLEFLKVRSTHYHIDISAMTPGWFFLADANYPGWTATLDGQAAPIYSGQVLGKAIWIPRGQHDLVIRFHSRPFVVGLWISTVSLMVLMAALIVDRQMNRAAARGRSTAG